MHNIQLIQILLVIAFLALSGLGWLIGKFREQSEKKRAQDARMRRIEEMLRTGRDPAAEPATHTAADDRARLEELARRRQAQMDQFRREHAQRRQEGQRSDRHGEPEPPPIIIMGPSGPIALPRSPQGRPSPPTGPGRSTLSPIPAPARPAPPRPAPARPGPQQRQQRPARPQPKPQRRPERAAPHPAPVSSPSPQRREPTATPASPVIPAGRAPAARSMITLPPIRSAEGPEKEKARSRAAEYRRLVAMMEVMKPPLALREENEPGPVYPAF